MKKKKTLILDHLPSERLKSEREENVQDKETNGEGMCENWHEKANLSNLEKERMKRYTG